MADKSSGTGKGNLPERYLNTIRMDGGRTDGQSSQRSAEQASSKNPFGRNASDVEEEKKPASLKKQLKRWAVPGLLLLTVGGLGLEHYLKQPGPSQYPDTHAGHSRQDPDAPQRHYYDPSALSDEMPSETHYAKGDLTKIFSAPDTNANVALTLDQGDCIAVIGLASNNQFFEVKAMSTQGVIIDGYVDKFRVRQLRPNHGCHLSN